MLSSSDSTKSCDKLQCSLGKVKSVLGGELTVTSIVLHDKLNCNE